ncbi:uncharacterized protein LOC125480201 [Pyrus x bretschneideri]|uniref:uncharacterized protein LOC125480201 n=1 Tax=Pyrus x bretschneideri TaxID=225117 RepID=UPI002030E7E3|nr:uncharacterized protein LOC125480201 [Pyrus x bretschneideri]
MQSICDAVRRFSVTIKLPPTICRLRVIVLTSCTPQVPSHFFPFQVESTQQQIWVIVEQWSSNNGFHDLDSKPVHQWLRPFGVPNGRSTDANRETGFDKKLLRAAVKELLKICAFRLWRGGAPTMARSKSTRQKGHLNGRSHRCDA